MREGQGANQIINSINNQFDIFDFVWDNTDSLLFCGGIDNGEGVLNLLTSNLEIIPETFVCHAANINSVAIDANN